MSTVTVQSDGHVDVDWEYEVPCPECGEMIAHLIAEKTMRVGAEFYIDGYDVMYDDEGDFGFDSDSGIEYYYPLCKKLLFDKEEDAKRFLLSLTWEPGLLPMPLRDENNLRTWTDDELKEEYLGLYDVIEVADCYSSSDYANYLSIEAELSRRGITVTTRAEFSEG